VGSHNTDPILCCYLIEESATPIGSFPPGSYTLQVNRWYQDGFGGTTTETLGVLPFTVEGAAAPPTPLPALGLPLLAVSARWLRCSRSRVCVVRTEFLVSLSFDANQDRRLARRGAAPAGINPASLIYRKMKVA
jgi:hypothetical protein